jgi:hypothetical protein
MPLMLREYICLAFVGEGRADDRLSAINFVREDDDHGVTVAMVQRHSDSVLFFPGRGQRDPHIVDDSRGLELTFPGSIDKTVLY